MRICFFDPSGAAYRPEAAAAECLPDTRAMLCQLALTLARRGHEVRLVNRLRGFAPAAGIRLDDHLALEADFWRSQVFDAVVGIGPLAPLLALPTSAPRFYWQTDADTSLAFDWGESAALAGLILDDWGTLARLWTGRPWPQNRLHLLPSLAAPTFFGQPAQLGPDFELLSLAPDAADRTLLAELLPLLQRRFAGLSMRWLLPAESLRTVSPRPGLLLAPLPGERRLAATLARAHLVLQPGLGRPISSLRLVQALASGCRMLISGRGLGSGWADLTLRVPLGDGQAFAAALARELACWQRDPQAWLQLREHQRGLLAARLDWPELARRWETRLSFRPPVLVAPRPLRWAFYDTNHLDYTPASPETMPLGGSQAALCYLGRSLAARGHRVSLINSCPQPQSGLGLRHLDRRRMTPADWEDFDMIVSLNEFRPLLELNPPAGVPARRIYWNQHNPHVPGVEGLAAVAGELTTVFVSRWQQMAYQRCYGLHTGQVLANGCPPFYAPLPETPERWLGARPGPLTLVYSSTPNRGLRVLIALFPALRALFPGLRLQVFSSLRVYQAPAHEEANFADLYAECRRCEGVEYHGSVPQIQLAAALRRAHVLAYPNVYEETSCIAAIEAMAAGCQIVTSDLGALPETTAGFAELVPFDFDLQIFGRRYFDALCPALRQWYERPLALAQRLEAQSRYALERHSWEQLAQAWETLAGGLMASSAAG